MGWDYNKKDYEDSKITIPAGKTRVRIADVEPAISKSSGNQMYRITLDVSNNRNKLFYYLTFAPDNPQMTNRMLGQIAESFGVTPNVDPNTVPPGWIGAVGACNVKLDGDQSKVGYFIEKSRQTDLPPWVEVSTGSSTAAAGPVDAMGAAFPADNTDLPFGLP
jgi:hypothetical protein